MEIKFYGGVGTIGGNKFMVEDGDTKIFLDFGQSFSYGEQFFTGWLGARERFGLKDHFALDLMPKIPGLYSPEALENTECSYCEPQYQGVFISHVHYDHLAHLSYLDPGIPVYMGETTLRILDSWETTGISGFGDHDYRTFRTGDVIKVDDMEVIPVHVDHSTPAAYGYIVHTGSGTLVYTGDLRLHGTHSHLTRDFIEQAAGAKPDIMICEGTRVAPEENRKNFTEQGVYDHSRKLLDDTDKLAFTCFYGRDVDRMKTFHRLAKDTGRKFVVSTKTAHLLRTLADDRGIEVPDPLTDENMLIYCREMNRYNKWEKEFIDLEHCVDARYINSHQGDLIMQMDFIHFAELIDILPEPSSLFIHSQSEPFQEDDIEDEVKHNWMDRFGLELHQAHASGHCSREEIFQIIREISPKKVYPVHTEFPELFKPELGAIVEIPTLAW
ncbi:MAG: MBL fold metallo-hydrolase [ANME-2 cluster archaeon]|nr:MBL fold metallo-hydrolase [ANME-2 cluster archaeon]